MRIVEPSAASGWLGLVTANFFGEAVSLRRSDIRKALYVAKLRCQIVRRDIARSESFRKFEQDFSGRGI
jgi:hypothetical protein